MRGKLEFPEDVQGSGDVLTHNSKRQVFGNSYMPPIPLACHFDYATPNGTVHVSTIPNPSHLEVPTPMAVGKARGRARSLNVGDYAGGRAGDGVLCLHHHGDGAFTGQVRTSFVCYGGARLQLHHVSIDPNPEDFRVSSGSR